MLSVTQSTIAPLRAPQLPDSDGQGAPGENPAAAAAAPAADFVLGELTPDQQISTIYTAYFGRAPDPEGLDYWLQQRRAELAEKGEIGVLNDIAESFRNVVSLPADDPDNSEAVSFDLFHAPAQADQATVAAFVDRVYQNLFNRSPEGSADDPTTGLGFWTQTIQDRLNGGEPIGDAIIDIASGAQDDDAMVLRNKIDAGLAFAEAFRNKAGATFEVGTDRGDAVEIVADAGAGADAVAAAREAARQAAERDATENESVPVALGAESSPVDAGSGDLELTFDAAGTLAANPFEINDFGGPNNGDTLAVEGADEVLFSSPGEHIEIETVAGGTTQTIRLVGVNDAGGIAFTEATAEDILGYDAFTIA